jgi:hypothetical protein
MDSPTYHIVIVKSKRVSEDAPPVHIAKKVELASGNLDLEKFVEKDEGSLIDAFKQFVDSEPERLGFD